MGGIFGVVEEGLVPESADATLQRMAATMSHRGGHLDSHLGSHRERHGGSGFGVGSVGHGYEPGPRLVVNNALGVVAVCEGEIYNQQELVDSLRDVPDLEGDQSGFSLIPFLYREHGEAFARRINGIFALAIWDAAAQKLLLIRDHLGSRSLFYHARGGLVVFGSTIKCLFGHDRVPAQLDAQGLNKYFACLAIPPPATIYTGINAVRPGHVVTIQSGTPRESSYWPLEACTEDYGVSREAFAERLRELFESAVTLRARRGGRIGALISGGVDSSSIACALFETAGVRDLQGFSIAFAEQQYSDAALQRIIYDRYPITPHEIVLSPEDFSEALVQGAGYLDSPVNDVAYAGMLKAMQAAAAAGCDAVFEGEGSDELFCTGHSHGELAMQRYLRLPWPLRKSLFGPFVPLVSEGATLKDKVIRMLARIGMSDLQRRNTWIPIFSEQTRARLLGQPREQLRAMDVLDSARYFHDATRLRDPLNIYQYGLTRLFLTDDLLSKNERMAAGAGVVNRTPYIDYRLVELAFTIPAAYKLQPRSGDRDGTKLIMKQALRGLMPDAILDRNKTRGFSQPTAVWYHGRLKDFVQAHVMDPSSPLGDVLDHAEARKITADFLEGRIVNDYFVNSLLILALWLKAHRE